jgi:hypothetical protein
MTSRNANENNNKMSHGLISMAKIQNTNNTKSGKNVDQ